MDDFDFSEWIDLFYNAVEVLVKTGCIEYGDNHYAMLDEDYFKLAIEESMMPNLVNLKYVGDDSSECNLLNILQEVFRCLYGDRPIFPIPYPCAGWYTYLTLAGLWYEMDGEFDMKDIVEIYFKYRGMRFDDNEKVYHDLKYPDYEDGEDVPDGYSDMPECEDTDSFKFVFHKTAFRMIKDNRLWDEWEITSAVEQNTSHLHWLPREMLEDVISFLPRPKFKLMDYLNENRKPWTPVSVALLMNNQYIIA